MADDPAGPARSFGPLSVPRRRTERPNPERYHLDHTRATSRPERISRAERPSGCDCPQRNTSAWAGKPRVWQVRSGPDRSLHGERHTVITERRRGISVRLDSGSISMWSAVRYLWRTTPVEARLLTGGRDRPRVTVAGGG